MFIHTDKVSLGVDIGGSHISSALVNTSGQVLERSLQKKKIEAQVKNPKIIIDQWIETIEESLSFLQGKQLKGIGVAMPGPFDYLDGISLLDGVSKYESLYGINIRQIISSQLKLSYECPILFENDAGCFGLGEALAGEGSEYKNVIAITLGTGFGAAFIEHKKLLKERNGIPGNGYLYNIPFKDGIAEDYISSRWLLKKYTALTGIEFSEVKEMATAVTVHKDFNAKKVFEIYGKNIAHCLSPWIKSFKTDCLVIGGSICKASGLFLPALTEELSVTYEINIPVRISKKMELSAIAGAAGLIENIVETKTKKNNGGIEWRKSSQGLMPQNSPAILIDEEDYNIFPFHSLDDGKIFTGYSSLADWITGQKIVAIDGFGGN
ncbi:MAG: ROK family protein, partial [Ginsengibacter sp.]